MPDKPLHTTSLDTAAALTLKEKEQGATDSKCTFLAGGSLAILPRPQSATSGIRMRVNIQAESYVGAIPFFAGTMLSKSVVAATTSLKRNGLSMSIIQDDSTSTIVSRLKRTPPLGSSSAHQLSLSRSFSAARAGCQGRTICLYPSSDPLYRFAPFGDANLYHTRTTWLSTPLRNCVQFIFSALIRATLPSSLPGTSHPPMLASHLIARGPSRN
ncbi:hypothetical protein EV421DRAFT_1908508 [Armillaria borealis]|uniref:Uncharacterized protein n=1 Tax=Armillaria borealis TaxID=47425 RepID=A0AA39MIJ7_9AGAR|nr:hypothetical protein EV421DRAFT_1908508 [Armillaria borealis]